MKIKDILGQGKPTLSFEVFPPKTEDKYESVEKAAVANTRQRKNLKEP